MSAERNGDGFGGRMESACHGKKTRVADDVPTLESYACGEENGGAIR